MDRMKEQNEPFENQGAFIAILAVGFFVFIIFIYSLITKATALSSSNMNPNQAYTIIKKFSRVFG